MLCFRCNTSEAPVGQMYCDTCCHEVYVKTQEEKHRQDEERERWKGKPDSWTYVFFCETCGIEIYRKEHVKRRTAKTVQEIEQQSRLALFQHVQRAQHPGRTHELRVNERWGDRNLEIPGVEPWTEQSERTSASRFLRMMGVLPE